MSDMEKCFYSGLFCGMSTIGTIVLGIRNDRMAILMGTFAAMCLGIGIAWMRKKPAKEQS